MISNKKLLTINNKGLNMINNLQNCKLQCSTCNNENNIKKFFPIKCKMIIWCFNCRIKSCFTHFLEKSKCDCVCENENCYGLSQNYLDKFIYKL